MTLTTTIELEVEITYDYDPGDPGSISGPPESSYPPEPESAELLSVKVGDVDILASLSTDEYNSLEAKCCEDARNQNEDRKIP